MIEVKRPFPKDEWFSVWNWIEQADMWAALADDNVPRDIDGFCALQEAMEGVRQCWGVWRDGILGGVVSMEPDPLRPWIAHCHCLFRKEFWGRKTTIPALRLVAEEIFSAGIERIEMRVFESNRAIRALIPLLGGREEGTLRHQTQSAGKPIDMVVFGLSADEFTATREGKSDIL